MNTYKYITCAFAAFMLSGCEGQLDITNPNQPTDNTFWKTETDFKKAITSCYTPLKNWNGGYYGTRGLMVRISRADDIIKSRDMDYAYTKLVLLFKKIKMYSDITDWASQNNLWEGFYALGVLCEKQGFVSFAYDIFSALASESPDRTWKILAEKELRK